MNVERFQRLIEALSPLEFEQLVASVLRSSNRFTDVQLTAPAADRGVDIVATETASNSAERRKWYFQVKKARLVAVDIVRYVHALAHKRTWAGVDTQICLVISGGVTRAAREALARTRVEIWDAAKLAEIATPDTVDAFVRGHDTTEESSHEATVDRAAAFQLALDGLPAGKDNWSDYQRLIADILEFLFCPPLQPPRYEFSDSESRNRRDVIFENTSADGFWSQLRVTYEAHYVIADAKNYTKPLNKGPILDIAHYLKPYGCGMFALLVSRRGAGPAAAHAAREQWIGARKMIVSLSDLDVKEMLQLRAAAAHPEEIVRKAIADFRMRL
jgi:hypothetical protein